MPVPLSVEGSPAREGRFPDLPHWDEAHSCGTAPDSHRLSRCHPDAVLTATENPHGRALLCSSSLPAGGRAADSSRRAEPWPASPLWAGPGAALGMQDMRLPMTGAAAKRWPRKEVNVGRD
jgi:hypothetical protein